MGYASQLLNYIKSNALGQPEGAWFDRVSGRKQPSLYAEPKNEMLLGQSSGYWKNLLAAFMRYTAKNPKASISQISKDTGLDEYQIKTLTELLAVNK